LSRFAKARHKEICLLLMNMFIEILKTVSASILVGVAFAILKHMSSGTDFFVTFKFTILPLIISGIYTGYRISKKKNT